MKIVIVSGLFSIIFLTAFCGCNNKKINTDIKTEKKETVLATSVSVSSSQLSETLSTKIVSTVSESVSSNSTAVSSSNVSVCSLKRKEDIVQQNNNAVYNENIYEEKQTNENEKETDVVISSSKNEEHTELTSGNYENNTDAPVTLPVDETDITKKETIVATEVTISSTVTETTVPETSITEISETTYDDGVIDLPVIPLK